MAMNHEQVLELKQEFQNKQIGKDQALKDFDWILVQDDDLRKALFDICCDPSNKEKMADMMQFNIGVSLKQQVSDQKDQMEEKQKTLMAKI